MEYWCGSSSNGLTERWDNLDKDPSRVRLCGTQRKTTLALAPQAWPELIVTYTRDSFRSSFEPIGVAPQRYLMDSVEAALSYVKAEWHARLFSAYSINRDQLHAGGDMVGLSYGASGSYRPTDRLTVVPATA